MRAHSAHSPCLCVCELVLGNESEASEVKIDFNIVNQFPQKCIIRSLLFSRENIPSCNEEIRFSSAVIPREFETELG